MASYTIGVKVNPSVQRHLLVSSNLCLHKPLRVTMSSQENQQSYCQTINDDIEAHLKRAIPLKAPLSVFEPMRHLSLPDSPDSAPALCVAACELVGGHRSQAMAAAAALHLVHAAMFAHENLPLTTRPTLRPNPGSTSPAHAFAPNVELLVPDAMVPFGFELLATSNDSDQNSSYQVLRVILEITRVAGSQGIVNGVYQETRVGRSDGGEEDTCRKKEGVMHACAAACGAIMGGAKEEEIEALRKYGLYVGMLRGYSSRIEIKGKEMERVAEMRKLAINELEHFKGRNVEAISSFVMGQ